MFLFFFFSIFCCFLLPCVRCGACWLLFSLLVFFEFHSLARALCLLERWGLFSLGMDVSLPHFRNIVTNDASLYTVKSSSLAIYVNNDSVCVCACVWVRWIFGWFFLFVSSICTASIQIHTSNIIYINMGFIWFSSVCFSLTWINSPLLDCSQMTLALWFSLSNFSAYRFLHFLSLLSFVLFHGIVSLSSSIFTARP